MGCGGRDGQVGYPEPRDPGEVEPKVYVVLGGPGGRCGALIKPGCGAVGFHVEAREGDGLCGMLTGDGCCSCLSRRLFVNYKETNPKNVFRYLHQSNCQARGGPRTWRGGALKPFSKIFFGCNLTRRFCVCGFVHLTC